MSIVKTENKFHTKKNWQFILLMFIGLAMLFTNQSFAMGSKNRPEGKGLYRYSVRELSRFLEKIGYPDYSVKWPGDITRNSDGTELRFINKKKAMVVSCEGSIKEISIPSRNVWLNDEYETLAWLDKGKVYYKNGMVEDPPFIADYRADPSGIYFMKSIQAGMNDAIVIYSIGKPHIPLAKVIRVHGKRIFSKNNKVYLFGSFFYDRDTQEDLYIFERKGNELIQTEKVVIHRPSKSPAPFGVADLSPWEDEILFVDVFDFPSRSEWYVYNLKTREMRKIGKKPFGGVGLLFAVRYY